MNLSAVIPTYRQNPDYLLRAIDSVHEACPGAEVIVIVDREQDFPIEVKATVIHSAGVGISAALNTGIRAATADYIGWLASDDAWCGPKREQLALMDRDGIPATFSAYQVPLGGDAMEVVPCDTPLHRLYYDNIMCGSTMVVRRDVLFEAGLYDEDLTYCQDWEMHCRIQHLVGWHRISDVLATVTMGVPPPGFTPRLPRQHTANAIAVEKGRCRAKVSRRWRMADAGQVPTWERVTQ